VPAGRWICGTVELRSHVELHLAPGAVLVQSRERDDFTPHVDPQHPPHLDRKQTGLASMLLARDCQEVAITGPGCIDADTVTGGPRAYFVICFMRCRGVRISDCTIRNAKGWTCLLSCCDEVLVHAVRMRNPLGTGDGFDLDGCRDVRISDCDIITGDDCIVIKTCKPTRSAERITITNCVLRTSCAAMKIGTETWHDVRHVTMSNCVVHRSGRAVQLFSMDGATVEDVVVTGLSVDTNSGIIFNRPIHMDCCKRRHGGKLPGVDHEAVPVGRIRRVTISDCNLVTDGRIILTGTDRPLQDITLRGIRMTVPWIEDMRRVAHTGDGMQCSNGSPDARLATAAVVAQDIDGFTLADLELRWPDGAAPADLAVKCELGEPQIDPHNDDEPQPDFHALWLRRVTGRIAKAGLQSSQGGVPAVHED
ncbi:MAG: glycoside hydrolase family 28 protein, partial [Planctomycetota bacterium]